MAYTNPFTYDILFDCTPKGIGIFDFYEYGYGTWFDHEGNGYMVRLFSLRDSNLGPEIGSNFPNNQGLGSVNPNPIDRSLNVTQKNSTNAALSEKNHLPPIEIKSNDENKSKFEKLFFKFKNLNG